MTKAATSETPQEVLRYLKLPYSRLVVPDDDGTFRAEILEFPGCIATGDTREEALSLVEDVAASWLASSLAQRQAIPEPIDNRDYSGRMVVRLPRSLHKKASRMAEIDGVSLNQLIITSLAEFIGEKNSSKTSSVSTNQIFMQRVQFVSVQNNISARWGIIGHPNTIRSTNFDSVSLEKNV